MSEPDSTSHLPGESLEPPAAEPKAPPQPSRLRRFFLRHLPLTVASAAVLLAITAAALYFFASSAAFENFVRARIILKLETATGGRVEIRSFHWNLLGLEAEADGVVIHGLEAPGEAPYAQAAQLRVRLSVLGFLSPRILLRDLEISQPQLHLIVYPDGSTNQPQPRKPEKPGKPALDRLFDLEAGRVEVEQGVLDYENRAAAFDFQDRHIPLDFAASDLSVRMTYQPAAGPNPRTPATDSDQRREYPESYRIEAGARDLNLARGAPSKLGKTQPPAVRGFFQATLDLTRAAATLRSLRITARSRGVADRTLEISGSLDDFAHPRWQAKAAGELDMRLLDPVTGYPFAPEGIAHLDLTGAGQAGVFRADGSVHVDNGSYIGTGVVATGVGLDAHLHADPEQLVITSIVARLRQGGQVDGDLSLTHWLPTLPGAARLEPAGANHGKSRGSRAQSAAPAIPPQPSNDITVPVDGKVAAQLKDVALDTLLEMVSEPPFQHLGFDTRINGSATALWINGDDRTLSVDALLRLTPPAQAAVGKTPASGLVDATYTQRDGAVDLRRLELNTPASQLEAHGHLGAYPLTSPSALAVDFHSQNLAEFDTVLRDLGVARNGRTGTAALPVALAGRMDFPHGTWTGSIVNPRLAGNLKATQLDVELPARFSANSGQPQYLRLDSVEASGSYSAARIDLSNGLLRRGKAEIALSGSLIAATGNAARGHAPAPSFDANSLLHLRLRAGQVAMDDLRPFLSGSLPVAGAFDAQFQLDGPIHALGGSGWAELNQGSVCGEPVERIRAQGSLANQILKLTSLTVSEDGGKIAATGSYDFTSQRFQLDAKGAGIDLARIEWLRRKGLAVTGKLGFTVAGSGTLDDPRLEIHASLPELAVSGELLGSLELEAHTANRAVTYDMTTRLEAAELAVHGQTALSGDYATQARLDFSRFDIGALFRLAHLQELNGESALAGTVTIEGPLARPEELRGEARLNELAVTVSGVHLQSEGGVHATLDHALIRLDPLHVTGEETDLRAQGTLSLKEKQQLDLIASGTINLKVVETLDPDLTAAGTTTFQVEAHGPLMNPGLRGRIDFQNASLSLEDLPNALSQLHGTLEFNQNRLEVRSLTAMTGGGLLSVGGFLAYQHGLFANLTITGNGIRIRYPQGVSSLADATLRLQGPQNNLLLSGDVLLTRFTLSPDLDITALAAQANGVETIAPADAPSNHIRLDVHITSSPQLSFQNAYAKLAGNVDLRLRGTVASPSLLGRISITEGSGMIAGTRYELQHGDIYFTNPVRIEPLIDLNATARVEDYDITLGLHGTLDNPVVTYRSDPPLPEADVVALLALGRTESQQRIYTQQQESYVANPTTDALLGGALNATVSSRVQKLFGAGTVKVDPNYLGVLGNSTTRIIVEEQLGTNVTLTYATDVDTTGQQLIQADIAINHHVSLQVARDESGVFSMVLKATRRYR
jgi:translocation and assembly module TamB